MKPMIIIPPDVMSEDNLKLLRENGICVVVASDPSKVKFVDPLPAIGSRTEIERAAIRLSRKLLNGKWGGGNLDYNGKGVVAQMFVELLVEGSSLDPNGTTQEQEDRIIDNARRMELDQIGREEARAERAAKKAAQQKPVDKK